MTRKYSIYSNSSINKGAVVIELNDNKEWSREERMKLAEQLDKQLNGGKDVK